MIRRAATAVAAGVLLVAADLAVGASPASAYATFGHRLTYGVGNYGSSNQHYWVDSTASEYLGAINTAMDNWIYTSSNPGVTTPISYTRTTTKSSSRMDHYQSGVVNSWWGLTQFYNGSTSVSPSSTNWVWARVTLDGEFADCPNRAGVIAHEQGHAMGLAHVTSGNAVMRQDIGSLTIPRARVDDLNGINHLY